MSKQSPEARESGEHAFGSLIADPTLDVVHPRPDNMAENPGRLDDLASQIEFLTAEVARYRELLEGERIRHATKLANQQLKTDARIDDLRRDSRIELQAIHDQYRSVLTERQVEHEQNLSQVAAQAAADLKAERSRHNKHVAHDRKRRETHLEATRKQTIDELSEAHEQSRQGLLNELSQAAMTIQRLQNDLDSFVTRAQHAEMQVHDDEIKIAALEQQIKTVEERYQSQLNDGASRLQLAEKRLETERHRAGETLAEVLERSAAVAATADQAKSDHAAELAKARHSNTTARQRIEAEFANRGLEREAELRAEYADLVQATDDRVAAALEREAKYAAMAQAAEERTAGALEREAEYAAAARAAEQQISEVLELDGKRESEYITMVQAAQEKATEAVQRAALLEAQYDSLARASEHQAAQTLERESQLEAVIADLRDQLDAKRS